MRLATCAFLAAFIVALPGAQAASAVLSFSDNFGTATMDVDGTIEGSEASRLRGYMDVTGNRDGEVSQDEATRFLVSYRGVLGDQVGAILTDSNLTLDGNALAGSELQTLEVQGAAGPVQEGPPIEFQANLTVFFQPAAGATHVLSLEGRSTPGGVLRMRFLAPDGWEAQATVGTTPAAPDEAKRSIAVDIPTDNTKVVATFTLPPQASPALGSALSLAILGALALVRRPREPSR